MVITKRLEQIKNTVKAEYETAKSQRAAAQPDAGAAALLPEPLTANAYEDSVRYRNYNSTPEHGGNKEHTVQIKLVKTSEADASEFYLVSVITSGRWEQWYKKL